MSQLSHACAQAEAFVLNSELWDAASEEWSVRPPQPTSKARGSAGLTYPDSRRYAAMGDAITVPVAEWIGRRLSEHLIGGGW